jgi:hypothetical protein
VNSLFLLSVSSAVFFLKLKTSPTAFNASSGSNLPVDTEEFIDCLKRSAFSLNPPQHDKGTISRAETTILSLFIGASTMVVLPS